MDVLAIYHLQHIERIGCKRGEGVEAAWSEGGVLVLSGGSVSLSSGGFSPVFVSAVAEACSFAKVEKKGTGAAEPRDS